MITFLKNKLIDGGKNTNNMKKIFLLLLIPSLTFAEARMTPLINLIQGEDWVKNKKTQLYIMQRCLAINGGLSSGTRTDKNKEMIEESSKKMTWFLNFQ